MGCAFSLVLAAIGAYLGYLVRPERCLTFFGAIAGCQKLGGSFMDALSMRTDDDKVVLAYVVVGAIVGLGLGQKLAGLTGSSTNQTSAPADSSSMTAAGPDDPSDT